MKRSSWEKQIIGVLVTGILGSSGWVSGYGPVEVADDGTAYEWTGSAPSIIVEVDKGTCNDSSRAEMLTMTEEIVAIWTDVPTSVFTATASDDVFIGVDGSTEIDDDITLSNCDEVLVICQATTSAAQDAADALADADQVPLIWDANGAITLDLIVPAATAAITLGFSSTITDENTNTIIRSEQVINCPLNTSEDDTFSTIAHELGHGIGLDHTDLHGSAASDANDANNDNDTVPLMYPSSLVGDQRLTAHADDAMGLSYLYPSSDLLTSYWTLEGFLIGSDGEEIPCANMILEESLSPGTISYTYVTATEATFSDANGDSLLYASECESNGCGYFVFYGLDPTKTYNLSVAPLDSGFFSATSTGSTIGRCAPNYDNSDEVNPDVPTADIGSFSVSAAQTTKTVTATCNNSACSSPTVSSSDATTDPTTHVIGSSSRSADGTTGSGDGDGDGDSGSSSGGCSLAGVY